MKGFPVRKKDSNIHVLEHAADSYFGSFPGVNGATTGVVKVNGVDETIPLNAGQNVPTPFCHRFSCAAKAYDQGAMDAFNLADQASCGAPPLRLLPGRDASAYSQLLGLSAAVGAGR